MNRASVLGDRLDALATALNDAGVSPERAARLLSVAAAATLDALALDLLRETPPEPVAAAEPREQPTIRLAA